MTMNIIMKQLTYLCLQHVYGVFSSYLSQHLAILRSCYCKKQIDVSVYASVLLLMINFVLTPGARGSRATLTML